MKNGKGKKRPLLADLADTSLQAPVGEVRWAAYRIAGAMDRRRLEGPRHVVAHTAHVARALAALEFGGNCDPLHVDVSQCP